jgi:hypothetical protein
MDINKTCFSEWMSAPHTGMDNRHERGCVGLIPSGAGAYWGISLGRRKNLIGVLTSDNANTPEDFSISHL